jgi:hypothetical protein
MDEPANPRISGNASIALAIVAAALILAWSGGDDEPRYQLAASGTAVYRMDTDSGELIACTPGGCARVEAPDRSKTLGSIDLWPPAPKPEPAQKAVTQEQGKRAVTE